MQVLNHRHHCAIVDPVQEGLHPGFDDGFGLRYRGLAILHAGLDHRTEIVDGVQKDVVETADFSFDVTRHGQVEHEHGLVAPCLDSPFDHAKTDDGQRGCGTRDNDVVVA